MQENIPQTTKYSKLYCGHDKFCTFNDGDSELRPFTIRLPDPPPLNTIVGYGKPPDQQKFTYEEEPERLKLLAKSAHEQANAKNEGAMVLYSQMKLFWQMLSDQQDDYTEEIAFIKRVHWHLMYGYWFFCLGKPTWITPWHYFYLNFYYPNTLRGKRVDYRDEDRITELFEWYCYTCTEVFKTLDKDGVPIPNEEGKYAMVDTGLRSCFGSIQPKRRRRGESMKGNSKAQYCTFRAREFHTVLQANVGKAASDLYQDHMLPSWKKLPLWLKPIYDGVYDSDSGIYLTPPKSVSNEDYLDSWIIWNDSAKEGENDRKKIHFIVDDESAKRDRSNISKSWSVDKKTLAQGPIIHGYSVHPSTVEEMTEGGLEYQAICDQSNFYLRVKVNGQTTSGLFRIFRPVYMGCDGFIDEYGYSVVDDPTEFQLKHPAKDSIYHIYKKGSKQYWTEFFQDLASDPTKQSTYRLEIRKGPMRYSDCWIGGAGDMGFDYRAIDQRLAELRMQNMSTKGNLKRIGDTVNFTQNDNGRFVFSNLYSGQNNPPVYGDNVWDEKKQSFVPAKRPMFAAKCVAGGDPFDYGNSNPTKKAEFHLSKGGGAVFLNADPTESEKNIRDWESQQLICYYENKPPSLEEYCEDMLAMCIYCGALMNMESNKKRAIEYFIDAGYGGYLWHATMPDGSYKKEPGTYNSAGTKNDMLNSVRDFIEYRVHKCCIKEFLVQAREMTHPSALTKLDGFTACGWAIYASK